METIAAALMLATLTEGFVSHFLGTKANGEKAREYIPFITAGLGVFLAILFQVDIFAFLGLHAVHPLVGYVVSGLVIGRGSNYLNDFVSFVRR